MLINLINKQEDVVEFDSYIYLVGLLGRSKIDSTFDKLYKKGKIGQSNRSSPQASPTFIVRRVVEGERKERIIINIRKVNLITIKDKYPIPS